MKKAPSRTEERERTARFLNTVDKSELWTKFGISRVSEISGFDYIGVPVWSSTRPLSSSVSINSGKGTSVMLARAGTIAESIEFHVAENPQPVQRQQTIGQMHRWNGFDVITPDKWHIARSATITPLSVFDWDLVAPIQHLDNAHFLFPTEGVYTNVDNVPHLMRLQSSTNGWATGSSLEDAVLQGLYEVIERDSWTIWLTLVEGRGVWPPRINIDYVQDWEWFHETLERMEEEALKVVLFDVTTDTSIPVVWALIYDLSDNPAGLFNGYGCAATQTGAIQRAVLEAIQSRACYIAGARDDLLRRSFMLMKHFDQPLAYEALMMQIPTTVHFDYSAPESLTAKQELARTLDILEQYGFTEFYVRNADHPYPNLYVAKVIAPCLEQYRCGYWQPTKRLFDFIARYANR